VRKREWVDAGVTFGWCCGIGLGSVAKTDDVEARFGEPERRSAFVSSGDFASVESLLSGRFAGQGAERERRRARVIAAAFAFGREQP